MLSDYSIAVRRVPPLSFHLDSAQQPPYPISDNHSAPGQQRSDTICLLADMLCAALQITN